ncbi:MAG: hypothetical protein JWM76_2686 [Pseudonocardiales bacterium]|nr:hypothetical protein [Pseudonocardiales bacterium]
MVSAVFPPATSLRLIKNFELRHGDAAVHLPLPAQRLLAFLALQRRPVPRRAVTQALWTDLGDRAAAGRLRSTLWRLPSDLSDRLVLADGPRLSLSAHIHVDVHIAADDSHLAQVELEHLCGDVLTDWAEDWVTTERERFRQLRLHRLEQFSVSAQQRGEYSLALQAALAAVAAEPLRESAHRRVMEVHLAEDNPSEALRQYESVRRLLREELGLAPADATRAVVADLLGRPLDSLGRGRRTTTQRLAAS